MGGLLCLISDTMTFPSHETTRPTSFEFNILTDGFCIVTFTFAATFAHGRASSCNRVNFIECCVYPRTRPKCKSYIPPTTAVTPPTSVLVATTIAIQQQPEPFFDLCHKLCFLLFPIPLDYSATLHFSVGVGAHALVHLANPPAFLVRQKELPFFLLCWPMRAPVCVSPKNTWDRPALGVV
jgi:hypothetical protein